MIPHPAKNPKSAHTTAPGCTGCTGASELDFDFAYAFQPIVDFEAKRIYGHEALIRGAHGEDASSVLSRINEDNAYRFDQACRVEAVKAAAELQLEGVLSINFLPNAVNRPELCIRTTLAAAEKYNFSVNNIIFEFSEVEKIHDAAHLLAIVTEYKKLGFKTALDDFGAGYAGLNLLAKFQPDIIKIDTDLVHNIDTDKPRQAIVKAMITLAAELDVTMLAEGVETKAERDFLFDRGINLMQGYLFGSPAFKAAGDIAEDAWLT